MRPGLLSNFSQLPLSLSGKYHCYSTATQLTQVDQPCTPTAANYQQSCV